MSLLCLLSPRSVAKSKRLMIGISLSSVTVYGFYLVVLQMRPRKITAKPWPKDPRHVFFLPTLPSVARPSMRVLETIKLDDPAKSVNMGGTID